MNEANIIPVQDVETQEAVLILYCALGGGVWSDPGFPNYTAGNRAQDVRLIGLWVGLRADLDVSEKRKIRCFCR